VAVGRPFQERGKRTNHRISEVEPRWKDRVLKFRRTDEGKNLGGGGKRKKTTKGKSYLIDISKSRQERTPVKFTIRANGQKGEYGPWSVFLGKKEKSCRKWACTAGQLHPKLGTPSPRAWLWNLQKEQLHQCRGGIRSN